MDTILEHLKELHELVKSNPYRINRDEKYLKGYEDLLDKLSHQFYLAVKETKFKDATNMIHDFNGSIRNLNSKDSGHWYHVERCIGTIHEFLDTGEINSYWTYYTGVNIPEGLPRNIKREFVDGKYYPVFKKHEAKEAIESVENKIKKNPKDAKWYEPELEWIKSAIIRG